MDYSLRCPRCGKKHVYYSHEIGATAECSGCGQALELREQPFSVVRYLIWPTIVAVGIILFIALRLLLPKRRPADR